MIDLGGRRVGEGEPCYVIAEIGINHNGDLGTAKRLIEAAADAGADAVKLQKRTVEVVYSHEPFAAGYLEQPRTHPLSDDQTQRGQKLALEFGRSEWETLAMHARDRGLDITASCWDERAILDVLTWIGPTWLKVASPCLTDGPLMRAHGATGLPLVVSTGMATVAEVETALQQFANGRGAATGSAPEVLLHCCSAYPSEDRDLNLRAIPAMRERWHLPVGYSGHEKGIATTVAAVALGACVVERHLTLDRTMYGSDQSASLEPHGFARMVRDIRSVEAALGDGAKVPRDSELDAARKLRRVVA